MSRLEKKLHLYRKKYLGKNEDYVIRMFGNPEIFQDGTESIWFYKKYSSLILKDEVGFIMNHRKVSDITITEYFLGFAIQVTYYSNNKIAKFKTYNIFPSFYLSRYINK